MQTKPIISRMDAYLFVLNTPNFWHTHFGRHLFSVQFFCYKPPLPCCLMKWQSFTLSLPLSLPDTDNLTFVRLQLAAVGMVASQNRPCFVRPRRAMANSGGKNWLIEQDFFVLLTAALALELLWVNLDENNVWYNDNDDDH